MPLTAEDETALVHRVRAGDTRAFEPLLDEHLPHIRAFIALKLPVSHLVDELAHEAFIFAFRKIADFQPGTSLRAWLRAIAWNLVRSELQRYAREQANLSKFEIARHAEWAQQNREADGGEIEALQGCLERVPDGTRRLLAMKSTEQRSTEEMAGVLGRSLEWIRITLFRVRSELRRCIEGKIHAG